MIKLIFLVFLTYSCVPAPVLFPPRIDISKDKDFEKYYRRLLDLSPAYKAYISAGSIYSYEGKPKRLHEVQDRVEQVVKQVVDNMCVDVANNLTRE